MPGYDAHRRVAETVAPACAAVAGLLVWVLTSDARVAFTGACVAFIAVVIGAQLPDLDSPTSVPRRRLQRLLQVATGLSVLALGVRFWPRIVTVVVARPGLSVAGSSAGVFAGLWLLLTAAFAVFVVPAAVTRLLPRHRGPLHDARFWLVSIGGVVAAVYLLDLSVLGSQSTFRDTVVWTTATGLLVGIFTHLVADGTLS